MKNITGSQIRPTPKGTLVDKLGHFLTLPIDFVDNSGDLSDGAVRLVLLLRRLTHSEKEVAWPSYAYIRRCLGWRREKISKVISELERAGILNVKRKQGVGSEYSLDFSRGSKSRTSSEKRTSTSSEKRTGTSSEIGTQYRLNDIDQRNRLSVCVGESPVAPAPKPETHTQDSNSLNKKSQKSQSLTPQQIASIAVLVAYFPTLNANHCRQGLAEFVENKDISPDQATSFCSWLNSRDRRFPFMKLALLSELWEESEECAVAQANPIVRAPADWVARHNRAQRYETKAEREERIAAKNLKHIFGKVDLDGRSFVTIDAG